MSRPGTRAQLIETPQLVTLPERLFDSAAARPHAVALIAGDDGWTYDRLARYIRRLSQGLLAQGLKPGDRVALHMTNKPETVAAYYACMLTGMIAVPLNNRLTRAELEPQLRRLQVSLYLGQTDLYGAIAAVDASILVADKRFLVDGSPQGTHARAWSELIEHELDELRLDPVRVDEPALLLSTSGTTGEPKFVTHTPRTACSMMQACQAIASRPYDVTLIATPMMHGAGLFTALTTLAAEGTCVLLDRFEPAAALDLIERHRCTMMMWLPFMYSEAIAEQIAQPRNVTSLGICLVGGDTTPPSLQEEFLRVFGVRMRNFLGMSESAGTFTYGFDTGPVCRAVDMDRVRLVDTEGNTVRRGEAGELLLRGPNLFVGYWLGPGRIDDARKDGWWATGDVLREDEAGDFWYVARKKNLIIRGGSNISPTEIEHALTVHRGVREAAIVGVPDPVLGQRVIGFVELTEAVTQIGDVLRDLSTRVASYKMPERLIVVEQLPRNSLGKVDRAKLKAIGERLDDWRAA
ncbi:class I adenylate-forming enzyme family protein [Paraburkholderia sp. FT54]|uniref:class I adenylate-forming enzyme family protein n=1 Tax=Paraburkholderia sp. FT54 TaxID=3074437 RepID=UPI0028774C21|nr:class I adenylate-forming enzyme family protein [Paraburkholderia sp. FT54]WNC91569.1 class I adenylate-forming enzyme family protein [Paraburkholderia sp. FT54]